MSDQEESGFTFVDKRRVPQESQDEPDSPTSSTSETEPSQEAAATDDGPHGAMPRLNVRDRLLMCIDILNQGAWISMGLISDPSTGNLEKDLDQAKAAIDSVAFLAERVEPELDESTRRELRNLVRDLQLNFVQQSSR